MKKSIIVLSILASSFAFGFSMPKSSAANAGARYYATQNETIHQQCVEAVGEISLGFDTEHVVSDFYLPILGLYKTNLSWTSSDSSVISISEVKSDAGKLIRIRAIVHEVSEEKTVTLTLKASIQDHEDQAATKTFSLKVIKPAEMVEEEIPLEIDEDFSSYSVGLDLSDYANYTQSGSESLLAEIVDGTDQNLKNVNDLVSSHALKLTSKTLSSDTRYTRKANIKATNAPSGAYLEGYFLFTGETNGVAIELLSQGKIVGGISFSSSEVSQVVSGSYKAFDDVKISEGVWTKFKAKFKPKSGYVSLYLYDYKQNKYVECTSTDTVMMDDVSYGISSGGKGDIDSFRIVNKKGKNVGASYLSDLHIGLEEEIVSNPNRSEGLGTIEGYAESLFATEATLTNLSKVDPKTFIVHNRFDEEKTFVYQIDYTIETKKKNLSTDAIEYSHTFTLTATGEKKTVTQIVYLYEDTAAPSLVSFKSSALKKDKTNANLAYLELSFVVNRDQTTFYYLVMEKGSTAPTKEEILSSGATLSGKVLSGNEAVSARENKVTTSTLDITKKYDVYAVLKNENASSNVVSSLDISTVVNISSEDDFYEMANDIDSASQTFKLTKDLDFSDYYWDYSNTEFDFKGVLDGQGYTISNLTISSTENRVGIFAYCHGDIRNITFTNCHAYGAGNVGLIAGNIYGGNYENIHFLSCSAELESTLTEGGEGYFGLLSGRCRASSSTPQTLNISNVEIKDASIVCPKYCGLLTGGLEANCTTKMENVFASGSVNTEGAAVGLIGRNRGDTTIKNLICYLTIQKAKKEVGVVAGHNKEGGKLSVENALLDLKVYEITQPGYMAPLIGSHDAATSSYSVKNVSYINEDYSDFGSYTVDVKSIFAGKAVSALNSKKDYEENTFIRDFDVNLVFSYDEEKNLPYLSIRTKEDIHFVVSDFASYVEKMDETKISENHYLLIKAGNVLSYLSADEKAKISSSVSEKYERVLKAYQELSGDVDDVSSDIKVGF